MIRGQPCSRPRLWRLKTLIPVAVAVVLLCGALLMDVRMFTTTRPLWLDLKTCSPKTNISFLKIHKCASSAVQNILFRYGEKHNLHFALPDIGNYFGSGGRMFRSEMVLSSSLNKLTPNIYAIHTKWNHSEMKKVMPEDTIFFTIVREPTALFKSLYSFSKLKENTGLTIEEYVRQVTVDDMRAHGYLGYNQMVFDLGMPTQDIHNLTLVREMVMRADEQFGLVMVAERMEESLVLLAKYLCWDLNDVLVLRLNSLRSEFKSNISEEARQVLQQKLAPDYLVYNHFLARFDQQVEAFGRGKMDAAVARLRELMALLVETCSFVEKEAKDLHGTQKPWSDRVDGYVRGGGDGCRPFTIPEISYINLLRKKHQKEIAKKFGLPPGPPMNAIPFGVNNNAIISNKDLQNLKRTLIHKDKSKTSGDKKKARTAGDA